VLVASQVQAAVQRQQRFALPLEPQRPPFVATSLGAGQADPQIGYGQSLREPGGPPFVLFQIRCWRLAVVGGRIRANLQLKLVDLQRTRRQRAKKAG